MFLFLFLQWNDVVHLFQVGMPTKKHRHLLKTYVDCFIASDPVVTQYIVILILRYGTVS